MREKKLKQKETILKNIYYKTNIFYIKYRTNLNLIKKFKKIIKNGRNWIFSSSFMYQIYKNFQPNKRNKKQKNWNRIRKWKSKINNIRRKWQIWPSIRKSRWKFIKFNKWKRKNRWKKWKSSFIIIVKRFYRSRINTWNLKWTNIVNIKKSWKRYKNWRWICKRIIKY